MLAFLTEKTQKVSAFVHQEKYSPLMFDYLIFQETTDRGQQSHKEAVVQVLNSLESYINCDSRDWRLREQGRAADQWSWSEMEEWLSAEFVYPFDEQFLQAAPLSTTHFFSETSPSNIDKKKHYFPTLISKWEDEEHLAKDKFVELNQFIFPDKQQLTIYEWNDYWTNHFEYYLNQVIYSVYNSETMEVTVVTNVYSR